MLACGGEVQEASADQSARAVALASSAVLVAAVVGALEVLSTQVDGLDVLAEASCQVMPLCFD